MFTIKKTSNNSLRSANVVPIRPQNTGDLGVNSKRAHKRTVTEARGGFVSESFELPTSMGPGSNLSSNAISLDLEPMLLGLTPQVESAFYRLYRDIYYFDSVAGSAVDLISQVTFSSEYSLGGISDSKMMSVYLETMERLNTKTLLPELSTDHLVLGTFCASLLYNKKKRMFADMMCHPIETLTITNLPFYSQDPVINVKFPDTTKAAITSNPTVYKQLSELVGESILEKIKSGSLDLDPLTTIYIPRKTFSYTDIGTSYYKRILPLYLIEKNLFRGTLIESARRQRGILHLTLGDGEEWIPQVTDMEFMTDLFMNADADPLGAIVATRSGVSVEEVRQGGDFWKVTDFADSVMPYKLRALAISESFLTGDANYNCVVGKSLISTTKGIFKIAKLANVDDGKIQDLNIQVGSRYGKEKTAKWLYQGKAPTLTVDLHKSSTIQGTPKHRVLVLKRQETGWKQLSEITTSDYVAVSLNKIVRTSKLKLDLKSIPMLSKNQHLTEVDSQLTKPNVMTPELAFVLGCVVAEGNIQGSNIKVGNTNQELLNKYLNCFESIFNYRPTQKLAYEKGSELIVNSSTYSRNKDFYLTFSTRPGIAKWFEELGVSHKEGRHRGKTPSYFKEIPWSILQADEQSQLSFLAAYLECDGSIQKGGNTLSFTSYSKELVEQLYVMISSMGYLASKGKRSISVYGKDAYSLYNVLLPYMITKTIENYQPQNFRQNYGLPSEAWTKVLTEAIIKRNNGGTFIRLESGEVEKISIKGRWLKPRWFLYDKYEEGAYEEFLSLLKRIDSNAHKNLIHLLNLKYNFTPVQSIHKSGIKDVYDLSMKPGVEPSYNVNCIVGHNTADAGLTIFVEMLRSYRDLITRKFFYDRLFPLVSMVHGYVVNIKGKATIREEVKNVTNIAEAMNILNDGSKLLIPTVTWAKQLKPEGDSAYMDLLQALTDKGVPVPLRVLASAGGLNLDELLRQKDDDLALRKQFADYMKAVQKLAPRPPEEGMGEASSLPLSSTSGVSSVLQPRRGLRPSILSRTFDQEPFEIGKTGKKHAISSTLKQNREHKINKLILKAVKQSDRRAEELTTPKDASDCSPF